MVKIHMHIRGDDYEFTRDDILRVARLHKPESITVYFVEIGGKMFPPKQLIRLATGTRKDFDSTNARSALTRLGFTVKALP